MSVCNSNYSGTASRSKLFKTKGLVFHWFKRQWQQQKPPPHKSSPRAENAERGKYDLLVPMQCLSLILVKES